jgi:perosamine synthetase
MMKIEFSKMYVDDDIRSSVIDVLNSGIYIKGERLRSFEREFAEFCGTRYSFGVSSGTSAILLALMALGIKKGDEVIVPAHTFVATASPAIFLGGTPVFADIEEDTYTIDPEDMARKITERTKAIIPVHLYGHPCDMDPINDIAQEKGIAVIEDACQAHGAVYRGKKAGSIGDIGCFSFFPSKNMTVLGEGGMVSTDNEELAEKISMLRDHGRRDKYVHEVLGLNLRMDEIHAAIGRESLKHISDWNRRRREIASLYHRLLQGLDLVAPVEKSWAEHVYHLYVIRIKEREKLAAYLNKKGVSTGVLYPVPLHRQPCMLADVHLPVTERCAKEILSLPMHPQLLDEEVEYVCDEIREAL